MTGRAAEHLVDILAATRNEEASEPGSGLDAVIRAVTALQVADIVTITERIPSGAMVVVATTDSAAAPLGDVYDDEDPSPCTTAALTGDTVVSPDIGRDGRWPRWTPDAVEHGIHAVVSVVLHRQKGPLGCLNLYFRQPHDFDADEVDTAQLAAVHASIELAHHRREVDLWKAIDARHLIGQAQGLIMAQFDVDASQAFAVLRRLSQQTNTKLQVIADRVVHDRKLVVPDDAD